MSAARAALQGGPGLIPEDEADDLAAALALLASIPANRLAPWHTVTIRADSTGPSSRMMLSATAEPSHPSAPNFRSE